MRSRPGAGKPVCVLASGDPFFFGVGAMLTRRFSAAEMISLPAPSAFASPRRGSAGASRTARCSRCTAARSKRSSRICSRRADPRALVGRRDARPSSRRCSRRAAWAAPADVCEAMGGPRERLRASQAQGFALERRRRAQHHRARGRRRAGTRASCRARPACRTTGSSMTARSPSATSARSRSRRSRRGEGELLWDIGAGSGSIAIEWMLADPANRAVAIEARRAIARRASRATR